MQDLRLLCLNCQKGYHPAIKPFLESTIASNFYDFLLLQEVDEKVAAMIEGVGSYKSLSCMNEDVQKTSHLRILYRNDFTLKETGFISFAKMNRLFADRAEPGFLMGTFIRNGEAMTMGSVHLHSGISLRIRKKEMVMIKKKLSTFKVSQTPTIFGGDFNSGPSENIYIKRFFAPQFSDTCLSIGPTLNSRYTEKGPHAITKIANAIAKVGIKLTFKTDHILVDRDIADRFEATVQVLPDRISDHSPIELTLSPKAHARRQTGSRFIRSSL